VTWKDFSPRIGFTYDLRGDGRNVVSSSYATYYGQMSPGQLSSQLAATGAVFVRYPWADANNDGFVQVPEVNTTVPFLNKSTAYDPANPTSTSSPTRVDPGVKNESHARVHRRLRPPAELADGGGRQLRVAQSTISSSGTIRDSYSSANFSPGDFQATTCPAGARCETGVLLPAEHPAALGERLHRTSPIGSVTSTASS
jgi:hypothetical protein